MEPRTEYEVYALKFAEHPSGIRGSYFYGAAADPYDEVIKLAYYVWLLRSRDHEIVVDLGYTAQTAAMRDRHYLRSPDEALRSIGTDCSAIPLVVLTHLHWDHVGCRDAFPSAKFVVQDAEMAFWTGRHLPRGEFRRLVEVEDLEALVRLNYQRRLKFVDGDHELAPGVTLHRVGGHSPGMQVVRVRTAEGHVVLASDASHLYANFEGDAPFATLTNLPDMYATFDRLADLADSPRLVIPGHDPQVLSRFEAVPGQEGLTVRIA